MKNYDQIINSILDSDLYKFSMQQAVSKKFPLTQVKYNFINRGNIDFPEGFAEELRKQVKLMENLALAKAEKEWIARNCPFLDLVYLDILEGYRFNSSEVEIIQNGGELLISIEGYWYRTILWEVPLMAIISELFFKMTNQVIWDRDIREKNNLRKTNLFNLWNINYADFGTRRRISFANQEEVVKDFVDYSKNFIGTSNVYLAYKYNIKAIGTHAHEWFSANATKFGYIMANEMALEYWVDVYGGDLGIALPDTFTSDVFFRSFNKKFAKLFDGLRWDSGEWKEFTDKSIAHYNKLGIDPLTKTIVFSDNLTAELACEINTYCKGKIKCSFGIGTHFTNDVGLKPINMVIKLIACKFEDNIWRNVIKISDNPSKETGDFIEIALAKNTLNI